MQEKSVSLGLPFSAASCLREKFIQYNSVLQFLSLDIFALWTVFAALLISLPTLLRCCPLFHHHTRPPGNQRVLPCRQCAPDTLGLPRFCYPLQTGRSFPSDGAAAPDSLGPIARHGPETGRPARSPAPGTLPACAFPAGSHQPIDRRRGPHQHRTGAHRAGTVR